MTLEKIKNYLDHEHGIFQGSEWLEMLAWCVNEIQTLELEKKSRLEAFVAMRGEEKKDNEKRFSRGNIAQQISWDRGRCKPGDFSKVACLECGWNTQFDDEMKLFCTQSDCIWTEK